jgi:hypothetical protein
MLFGAARYNAMVNVTELFLNLNLRGSVQFHQTPEMKEKIKGLNMELMDFDGCSEIWVKSLDDWDDFAQDKEFGGKLFDDAGMYTCSLHAHS